LFAQHIFGRINFANTRSNHPLFSAMINSISTKQLSKRFAPIGLYF